MQSVVRIAYAFTKSDYKTIIGPVIFYALMSSPRLHLSNIPALVVWVWLHLLQACAANQMNALSTHPCGRISIETTRVLRWALVPVCLWLSWIFKVIYPGISLSLALIIYNELGLDSYWYTKNILNAIGIVSWNVGGAKIAALGTIRFNYLVSLRLKRRQPASTIHVQDFRDEKGDRLQGRITFPVVMPEFSRYMTFILIVSWSVGLSIFWRVPITAAVLFIMFGFYLAGRVVVLRSENQDKVSLRYYMVSLDPVLAFGH
ncbi:hypothetical protein C8J56DRAFT_1006464 [Mycena floridula]|nr:hypothetical protein C8J56DRAFT_1006464 [Mycena floridula]